MMQLFLSAWSVIADLCSTAADTLFCSLVNRLVVMFSTSFLCPSSLVPNILPVSLIYVWLQLLQGIWYTQSVFFLSSTLSFGCTSILLVFWWGLTDVAIAWCFNICCTGSATPLKYGSVTIPLDFSVFFSLVFSFWDCCSFTSFMVQLGHPHLSSAFGDVLHLFLSVFWLWYDVVASIQ